MVESFGDYRCSGQGLLDAIQSSIYFGGIIGMLLCAKLSEVLMKRQLIICLLSINVASYLMVMASPWLLLAGVGLFLEYTTKTVLWQVISCVMMESVDPDKRPIYFVYLCLSYAVGVTINGPMFYLIPNWQVVLLLSQVVPNALVLLG